MPKREGRLFGASSPGTKNVSIEGGIRCSVNVDESEAALHRVRKRFATALPGFSSDNHAPSVFLSGALACNGIHAMDAGCNLPVDVIEEIPNRH